MGSSVSSAGFQECAAVITAVHLVSNLSADPFYYSAILQIYSGDGPARGHTNLQLEDHAWTYLTVGCICPAGICTCVQKFDVRNVICRFKPSDGVICIAATNFPQSLDKALIRPGRFDRHVTVPNPDVKGRKEILEVHFKNVPAAKDIDLKVWHHTNTCHSPQHATLHFCPSAGISPPS